MFTEDRYNNSISIHHKDHDFWVNVGFYFFIVPTQSGDHEDNSWNEAVWESLGVIVITEYFHSTVHTGYGGGSLPPGHWKVFPATNRGCDLLNII